MKRHLLARKLCFRPSSLTDITSTGSGVDNPYMFTGRRFDEETGIYHYRARQYDPAIGRFLQRDPLGYYDSMNLYEYAVSSPVNYIDPLGNKIVGISARRDGWGVRITIRQEVRRKDGSGYNHTQSFKARVTPHGFGRQIGVTLGAASVVFNEVLKSELEDREINRDLLDATFEIYEYAWDLEEEWEEYTPPESGGGGASGSWEEEPECNSCPCTDNSQ